MKYKISLTIALFTSVFIPSSAHTAETDFEEIIVSATRYARPLSEIGSSVTVITAEDMEKSQTVFIQDILQNVAGVSLNQNGPFGGTSSVRIRGAASAQTVVLIDGIQMNDVAAPNGGYDFANLDPSGVERIEVLRGPQSILYGSDAMGGVVNIITPTGTEDIKSSLYAEGGSYNTFRAGGNIMGQMDKISFNLSASTITTDGISKADKNDGNSENDGYRNISLHGKITAQLSENHSLQLISRYGDSRVDYDGFPPPFYSLSDTNDVSFSKEFLIAGRGFFNYLDGALQNSLSVEYSTIKRRGENDGLPVSYLSFEGNRLNLDYLGHYDVNDDFGISFGLQHEETKSDTISSLKFNIDSVFSELSWQGIDGLTITAGLRYDDHNQYGGTTTSRFTAAYYFPESNTKIFANWGEGFKAPTIYQLTDGWSGNPDLRPEESNGWEIGIEQNILDNKIQIGITYFDQKFKNMIGWNGLYFNLDNVHTKGIEIFADLHVTENLSLSGNYTYTNAKDTNLDTPLIRTPKNAGFAEITWQTTSDLSLGASMIYNGKESDAWTDGTKGWLRFDLKSSYQLTDKIEFYGRIDNLFDKEYQQVAGYGTPDRSYYIGLRGKF
ncbi:MAG: TonB-dependent receptor [Emcibacter sp.]|nr:TonB-dependent receptor [Emcibacter sp.]